VSLWRLAFVENLTQPFAFVAIFNFKRNSVPSHPGEHDEELSGQSNICAKCGAFGLYTFLGYLNDKLIPLFKTILDGWSLLEGFSAANVFGGGPTGLWKIAMMQVAYMKETVSSYSEIHKYGLYAGLNVYDPSFIDIADVAAETCPLNIQFLERAIFNNGHSALFGLSHIYEHLSCH
jgi:hypothetical protein